MWEYANGIDNSIVAYKIEKPKSISRETTLAFDLREKEKIEEILKNLTEEVAYRLRKEGLLTQVISVELKNSEFKLISHQKKIQNGISNTKEIFSIAKELLKDLYVEGKAIRLVGIRVDKLIEKDEAQISLFNSNQKQEKVDEVIDKIKQKYGYNKITRICNINKN